MYVCFCFFFIPFIVLALLSRSLPQHSTAQYSTVQYSTVQYSTVQYSTVVTQIQGDIAGPLPPSPIRYDLSSFSSREEVSIFSSLVGSRRIALRYLPTLLVS